MTVKVTGFTIEDALEAKTKVTRTKYYVNILSRGVESNAAAEAVSNQQKYSHFVINEDVKPRTKIGSEALRDSNIDLDTVNFAFDRAMKLSHG